MRHLSLSSEQGLQLLSRHGVLVASEVSRQTQKETQYFMSIFVDRASHQPCVIFSRAHNHRDPYVYEQSYALGWPGKFSYDTKGRELTTKSIGRYFEAQKASLFAHIAELIAANPSSQSENLNLSSYQYRSTVEQVVQMFFETEALLLETTFIFQSEAGTDASSMIAIDAHVVLDDAAYKSCGRQKAIHECVTTTSTDDETVLQASRDGITYFKLARESPRCGRQANETQSQA